MLLKKFSLVSLSFILLSCYPTYNWRLVQTEEFGWEALFPAKPKRDRRNINITYKSKQKVITVDRYSVVLNDMNFVLDVMSYEGNTTESDIFLKNSIKKSLRENFNVPEETELVDGVQINGFIDAIESKPVVLIIKHLQNHHSMARATVLANPKNFKTDQAYFFLESIN